MEDTKLLASFISDLLLSIETGVDNFFACNTNNTIPSFLGSLNNDSTSSLYLLSLICNNNNGKEELFSKIKIVIDELFISLSNSIDLNKFCVLFNGIILISCHYNIQESFQNLLSEQLVIKDDSDIIIYNRLKVIYWILSQIMENWKLLKPLSNLLVTKLIQLYHSPQNLKIFKIIHVNSFLF